MPCASLTCAPFGTAAGGRTVERWTLTSPSGVSADVLTFGGTLHSLRVPDVSGRRCSVVLGLPGLDQYAGAQPFLGAVVGRYANRIDRGVFRLGGSTFRIPATDRGHALHGGPEGFHAQIWRARPAGRDGAGVRLVLELHSPDGHMGFPGALDVTVGYRLDDRGTLAVDYRARTDRPTVLNLTNHAYFNLAGTGDVLGHVLALDAHSYLPVSAEAIPLGPASPTDGTAFDFRHARAVGARIDGPDPQLADAGGYDHCFVLDGPPGPGGVRRAARLADPASGRRMEVWTTEPGLQLYTGNALDGTLQGPDCTPYGRYAGLCLETQHFPDSPNRPEYPSTLLRPGQEYRSRTELRFPHLPAFSAR